MSNPYLTDGTPIKDFSGGDKATRTFVTSVSFNDDNIMVQNGSGKTVNDTKGKKSLFINPIMETEEDGNISSSVNHSPPFIDQSMWANRENGLMYSGSFSVLRNGALTPQMLIPDIPNLLNNFMEWDAKNPGEGGTSYKNGPWIWKARMLEKFKSENGVWYIKRDSYYTTENFNSDKSAVALQVARSKIEKGSASKVSILTNPHKSPNVGISLELNTKKAWPLKHHDGSETESKDNRFYNNCGFISGGSLGSFTLLMSLKQDQKIKGSDIDKTPPWDVTISLGPPNSYLEEDPSKFIFIRMSKGSMMRVSVFGTKTEFNLPSPPVSTITQSASGEDPNTIAITIIPVFNGIEVSVGNYNGVDKKITGTMSQFCKKNLDLDINSLYSRTINVEYPLNEDADSFTSSLFNSDEDEVGPSIEVLSTSEKGKENNNGLIEMGDQLNIELFNVTGDISYIPVFFQTHSDASLYFPVETDVDEINDISYQVWPLWCKNGMDAFLQKENVKFDDYELKDIKGYPSKYTRTQKTTEDYAISTIILEGENRFSAGDSVKVSGLKNGNGIHTLTESTGSSISWHDSNNSNASQPSIAGGSVILVGEKRGTMLKYNFRIKCGERKKITAPEVGTNVQEEYDAAIDRLNNSLYSRYPPIIYGALIVRKESIDLGAIHNDNTPYFDLGNNWKTCITNISVTHSLEGSSGNMTLDRYALTQLYGNDSDFGIQKVGQVALAIAMGKSGVDDVGTTQYAFNLTRDGAIGTTQGDLISGFGYGFGIDQSSSAHQITVPLYGINRKLEEMKLINAPYFDGKTIKQTVDFLCGWGNVEPDYSAAEVSDKLSASSVLGQVRHEFKAGTTLWDAMQEAADDTSHYIIVQPDAKVHVIKFDRYGEPDKNYFTPKNWTYPNARILNFNRNPDFSQFYNKIIVMGLQNTVAQAASSNPDANPLDNNEFRRDFPISPIAVGADLTNSSNPHIPWEKISINPLNSYWTEQALTEYAQVLAKQALSIYYTGTTTIAGNLGINLFDKINDQYWVTSISHNFDLLSKNFTTNLTLSVLRPSAGVRYDSNGQPIATSPSGQIEPYDP